MSQYEESKSKPGWPNSTLALKNFSQQEGALRIIVVPARIELPPKAKDQPKTSKNMNFIGPWETCILMWYLTSGSDQSQSSLVLFRFHNFTPQTGRGLWLYDFETNAAAVFWIRD